MRSAASRADVDDKARGFIASESAWPLGLHFLRATRCFARFLLAGRHFSPLSTRLATSRHVLSLGFEESTTLLATHGDDENAIIWRPARCTTSTTYDNKG